MKSAKTVLLLLSVVAGCTAKQPQQTARGNEVLMEQRDVSLYRKAPKVWPAKGKVVATSGKLIFIPTPYFGALHVNGQDSTFVQLSSAVNLEEKKWMLVFPFGLQLTTEDGSKYTFVTTRRRELSRKIRELKQEE